MKKELNGFTQAFSDAISKGLRPNIEFVTSKYDNNIDFHCSFLLFIKSYRHFDSIKILYEYNIFQDAFVLLRCLFESVLCCILFSKDKKNIDRWVKYQQFIYFKEFSKDKSFLAQQSTFEKANIKKEYDSLKTLFTNVDSNGKEWVDRYWYKGGLRVAAIETDLIKHYEFCYKIGSDFVHTSSKIGQFYIDLNNKEETFKNMIGSKTQKNIDPIVIFTAMYLMLYAIEAIRNKIEIMDENTIDYWDKRLSNKIELYSR